MSFNHFKFFMKYIGIPKLVVNHANQYVIKPNLYQKIDKQFKSYNFKEEIYINAFNEVMK